MTPEEFQQNVNQLCGTRLIGVRYYELPGGHPEWNAHTGFECVDQGLDLLCDSGEFHVTWDNTFWSYGLKLAPGRLINQLLSALYSDVTADSGWASSIGHIIVKVDVDWGIIYQSETIYYPQGISVLFDDGRQVLISASIYNSDTQSFFGMSDHVIVSFEQQMIDKLRSGQ